MTPYRLLSRLAFALILAMTVAAPAAAQNPFEAVARVNDSIVTRFEVVQRNRLLQVLRRPGASPERALETLIEDRLKTAAAAEAGIVPTEEDITFGMEDFAARANLTAEEFITAIEDVGIARETFRDYVAVLITWGELVRERFGPRARPSEAEIDRALALGTGPGAARVLLSEIVLPVEGPGQAADSEARAAALAEIEGFDAFSVAARRFSVAPSRADGGRLDWLPLSELPAQIAPLLLTLQPGDVTDPIVLPRGIALFQLRAIEDVAPSLGGTVELDHARIRFAPGTDLAAERDRLIVRTDGCGDLWGVYRNAGEDRLIRDAAPRGQLPGSLVAVLDRLDDGEVGVRQPAGASNGGELVMLCERRAIREEELTRAEIERQLFQRRLESFGDSYLAELRADAFIEILEDVGG